MSQPSNKTRLYEALGQIVVSFKALEQALDALILACMKCPATQGKTTEPLRVNGLGNNRMASKHTLSHEGNNTLLQREAPLNRRILYRLAYLPRKACKCWLMCIHFHASLFYKSITNAPYI